LTLDDVKRIWKPDVFFSNSKSEEPNGALEPNILVRIYPDGNVLFSTRLTLTLGCPMDLMHYPFDKQSCPLKIASCEFFRSNFYQHQEFYSSNTLSKSIVLTK
jgi:hypothetical protein